MGVKTVKEVTTIKFFYPQKVFSDKDIKHKWIIFYTHPFQRESESFSPIWMNKTSLGKPNYKQVENEN